MVMVIASALVETLVKHMFTKYLNEQDKIEVGGAPSWYMKPIEDQMCVFTHKQGGLDTIDISKENATMKMIKKIDTVVEIVIYDNTKKITNEKEKAVVQKWKHDDNLPMFVNKNINFSRISYEDEIETTFVRACIPKNTIVDYQKERLQNIQKEVLHIKAKRGYDDLDDSMKGKTIKDPNDPFSELPPLPVTQEKKQ